MKINGNNSMINVRKEINVDFFYLIEYFDLLFTLLFQSLTYYLAGNEQ